MTLRNRPLERLLNKMMKRGFDVVVSSVALVMLPLLGLPIAIAIKLSSPGPVFFVQRRTGYRGKEFNLYKFRSMKMNDEADTKQACENDSRITKIGSFLRRAYLDELPQFLNVWLGDMSVVGPRPHMLLHTDKYSGIVDSYMTRHEVKPGITGWAQVNGLRGSTEELWKMRERVRYDLWYIENWSFFLDLKILYKTLCEFLPGKKHCLEEH